MLRVAKTPILALPPNLGGLTLWTKVSLGSIMMKLPNNPQVAIIFNVPQKQPHYHKVAQIQYDWILEQDWAVLVCQIFCVRGE